MKSFKSRYNSFITKYETVLHFLLIANTTKLPMHQAAQQFWTTYNYSFAELHHCNTNIFKLSQKACYVVTHHDSQWRK